MQSPPILTGTSPLSYQQRWSSRVSSVILTANLTAILAAIRPSPPVLVVVSSVPAAILTVQHLHLKPVTEGDHQNLGRCSEAGGCSDCEGLGTAARLGGCRAYGGCSDCEVRATVRAPGTAAARLSSSLPRPRLGGHFGGIISVATFRWQHSVSSPRRPAVSSPRRRPRRVVVVAASSSSSRRRRCRVVVLVASSSSPCHRRRRRRVVVASCRRRVIRPRLYPHPRPSPPVLVVALSCVRLYPTAILTPRPSPPVLVVAQSCHPSPPLSSPLSSPESSPLSSPPTLTTSPSGPQLPETREGGRLQRL